LDDSGRSTDAVILLVLLPHLTSLPSLPPLLNDISAPSSSNAKDSGKRHALQVKAGMSIARSSFLSNIPASKLAFQKLPRPRRPILSNLEFHRRKSLQRSFSTTIPPKMKVECQCGTVSFVTKSPKPVSVYHCHCTECQKQSSSAFGTSAIFPASELFPLSDDLRAKLGMWSRGADSGNTVDCYFCKECGARVIHRIIDKDGTPRPVMSVKGGLVEGLDWKGATHIYTASAVVPIPEGVETYEKEPPKVVGREGE
jgi:hypothetical protein